jgi:hypothetical protein
VGRVNLDQVKEFYVKLQSGIGSNFWIPKSGVNLIRILPPKEEGLFFCEVRIHYLPNDFPIKCLRQDNEPCPICDLVDNLRKSESAEDVERSRRLSAKRRYLINIIDLDDLESGVQIYPAGREVLRQLLTYFVDPDWGDLTDPDKGYDIVIEKAGSGLQTSYTVRPRKNPTPIPDKSLLEKVVDLSSVFPKVTQEEVTQKLINIQAAVEVSSETPRSSSTPPKNISKGVTDDEFRRKLEEMMGR